MTMQPAAGPPSAPLVIFGNVYATSEWIVTPAGAWPLAKTNVTSVDQTSTTTHTPAWAIVMVIVFIWFFLLSLLFLLAKERRISGYVAVHIQCGDQSFMEQVPVYSDAQRADVFNRVRFLQGLIGQARANAQWKNGI
jgi:hypothetical protein